MILNSPGSKTFFSAIRLQDTVRTDSSSVGVFGGPLLRPHLVKQSHREQQKRSSRSSCWRIGAVIMASEGKLKGKVAIVTGGSRGIGREICEALAGDGASIVVNYAGNVAAANEAVGLIEATGSRAIAVKGDVSKAADVVATFDKAVEAFGAVHIVVHSAGILLDNYPNILDTTEDEWDRTLTTNAKGTFLVAKEAAKRLGPGGRIITTSSSMVGLATPGYGAYSASKAAVEAFTKTLSKELRGRRITVNCIAPGPVATEMFFKGKTQERIDFLAKLPPLERLGEPKDISAVVQFLASDASEWVNGQVIRLNGGVN